MTDLSVPIAILQQLGRPALVMLGAKDFLHAETALTFRVRGSKAVSHIRIELDRGSDTYKVTFSKVRGLHVKEVASLENVHSDSLHRLIESHTGLYTKL